VLGEDERSVEAVERRRSVRSVVIITMSQREVPAQHIIIKFLFREGVKPAEILRRLTEQFKEETLSRARVFVWHKQFVESHEHVENEGHDRRPRNRVTENIRRVQQLLEGDRRLTVAEIAGAVGMSYGSSFAVITDELGFRKVCPR
jgi:hypothetical protein